MGDYTDYEYRGLEREDRKQDGMEKDYEWVHRESQRLVGFK